MACSIKYLQRINFNNHKRKYILYFVYAWSMLMLEITLAMVKMMLLFFPWSRRLPGRRFFSRSCMLAAQNSAIYSCEKMSHGEFRSVKQVPLLYPYLCALILNRLSLFTWLSPRRYCFWHSIQPGLIVHTQESRCRFKLTIIIMLIHNNNPSELCIDI